MHSHILLDKKTIFESDLFGCIPFVNKGRVFFSEKCKQNDNAIIVAIFRKAN